MKAGSLARVPVPLFLLWFVVAFGIICVMPWHPSKSGSLLPLGTPYLNGQGLRHHDAQVLLLAHCMASFMIAASIDAMRWVWKRFRRLPSPPR